MGSLLDTYQLIADILSFKSDEGRLECHLKKKYIDWECLVKVGSEHLVLPTIFCRLQQRNLAQYIPRDLFNYLENITAINRNRNITIIEEISLISKLLIKHNIDHVFLKGTALIIGKFYDDIGERMVGDIDILVDSKQIHKAFLLIKSTGYNKTHGFAYKTIGHRHLDRLIKEDKLAAIELHQCLINKTTIKTISPNKVLKSRLRINHMNIPCTEDMLIHTIFSWQINDKGHYYNTLSFKSVYDCLVLAKSEFLSLQEKKSKKYFCSYFNIASYFFKDFTSFKVKQNSRRLFFYTLQFNLPLLYSIILKLKFSFMFIKERVTLMLFNKHYRKYITTKILFPGSQQF